MDNEKSLVTFIDYTPDCCDKCHWQFANGGFEFCGATWAQLTIQDGSTKPDWCPRKKVILPERKVTDDFDPHIPEDVKTKLEFYVNGWNDCIDELENALIEAGGLQ